MSLRFPPLLLAPLILVGVAAMPASAQDAGEMVVRLTRLENQLRQMSGQIEQLQFENRKLTDQLKKFQEDVEFRFQERGGNARPAMTAGAPAVMTTPGPSPQSRPQRRGDAFDPALNPNAPGAPKPLGSPQSASTPLPPQPVPLPSRAPQAIETARAGPVEGAPGLIGRGAPAPAASPDPAAPLDLDEVSRAGQAKPGSKPGPSVAATGSGDPHEDYEGAYASILQRRYEQAEMSFRRYLQSHPRDRLVPEATYWLGESYYQRGRYREAAEQYLKVTTDYSRSGKAPDSLLKLGMSLIGLGAREQACATFGEIGRKFPAASNDVRQAVEREKHRAKC